MLPTTPRLLITWGDLAGQPRGGGVAYRSVGEIHDLLRSGASVDSRGHRDCSILQLAVVRGDVAVVGALLVAGASVKGRTENGDTILHLAARGRCPQILLALLVMADTLGENVGQLLKARNASGMPPLVVASRAGHAEVVNMLLAHTRNDASAYEAALHYALVSDFSDATSVLLHNGPSTVMDKWDPAEVVHLAATAEHIEVVYSMMLMGADPNAKDRNGRTALHRAVAAGHCDVASALVRMGSSVLIGDKTATSPLQLSVRRADVETVEGILDALCGSRGGHNPGNRMRSSRFAVVEEATAFVFALAEAIDHGHQQIVNAIQRSSVANLALTGVHLHVAVLYGRVDVISVFLEGGVSPDSQEVSMFAPLHLAASLGRCDVVQALLDGGACIDQPTVADGSTALHLVADGRSCEVMEVLLERGASLYDVDGDGRTALHLAVRAGSRKCVSLLASRWVPLDATGGYDRMLLDEALKAGDPDIVQVLLHTGASTERLDEFGFTPLQAAVLFRSNLTMVKLLLNAGASVHASSPFGYTPLHLAAFSEDSDVTDLLIARGAPINCQDSEHSPLDIAVSEGNSDVVRTLIHHGADTLEALRSAMARDDERAVHLLLTGGLSTSSIFAGGRKPLHEAADAGCVRTVSLLLQHGAIPNVTDSSGMHPLHVAAERGCLDVLEALLLAGADPYAVDMVGNGVLMKAATYGHDMTVHDLLSAGATALLDARNNGGDTALHIAARRGHSSTVQLLSRTWSADVNATNNAHESVLCAAVKGGHDDCVRVLVAKGASIASGCCSFGSTMYLAAHLGQKSCIAAMVGEGLSINCTGDEIASPLLEAVELEDSMAVGILLEADASVWGVYDGGDTIMHRASDRKTVALLIEWDAPLGRVNVRGFTPLHTAALCGNVDVLRLLLDSRDGLRGINSTTGEGMSALHYAAREQHVLVVELLMSKGADAWLRDGTGRTALHVAVHLDSADVVKAIVNMDARAIHVEDSCGVSPFTMTFQSPHANVSKFLLAHPMGLQGQRIDVADRRYTHLHIAARVNAIDAIETLILHGVPVDRRARDGQTALHFAAVFGKTSAVRALLALGATIDAANGEGRTPLHAAVAHGHEEIVAVLLAQGANVRAVEKERQTALHLAFSRTGSSRDHCPSIPVVETLLAHGAPTCVRDKSGRTPLFLAADCGREDAVTAILQSRGAASMVCKEENARGVSPLLAAVSKKDVSITRILLAHRAAVNVTNRAGIGLLHMACRGGDLDIVDSLLRGGASPGIGGVKGLTPLHAACLDGHTEVVRALLNAGAVPGHCWNLEGVSPLHLAARGGHVHAAKLLLPSLVDRQVNQHSRNGVTPLMEAVGKQDSNLVDVVSGKVRRLHNVGYTGSCCRHRHAGKSCSPWL